ncbi:TIGR02206 family membrane protein [Caldibacillus lycopersici]|uniref:TIGR02206 family membrane protein n=1 Tax=Perspicuibacillus lycopersici TaxID=1325689 RepID=A0AAE3LQ19_9BACI|nr:TIGR02206 family membrane protein [Perspicuibacillus lycopersici]MCU9612954.1 TIGR02206 family membrane protein [Perspicuibacillus lycopersici]
MLLEGRLPVGIFGIDYSLYSFSPFSFSHLFVLFLFLISCACLYVFRTNNFFPSRRLEYMIAFLLIGLELFYQLWSYANGIWLLSQSLPLELCSITLFLALLLIFTQKKIFYELVFFTALLGATQALITPVLAFDFPHTRFFHFFLSHMLLIWVALYYTWNKGYRPTIWSIVKVFLFLNLLLPFIMYINTVVNGNYMFLSYKPTSASLLDVLGPYPWYILSLEGILIGFSIILWLLFRKKKKHTAHIGLKYPIEK